MTEIRTFYSDRWKQINTNEAVSYKLKFNLEGLPICVLLITVVYIQKLRAKFRGNEVIMKLCGYCNKFLSLQKIHFFLVSLNAQATEFWSSSSWAAMLNRASSLSSHSPQLLSMRLSLSNQENVRESCALMTEPREDGR